MLPLITALHNASVGATAQLAPMNEHGPLYSPSLLALGPLFSKDINPCASCAFFCIHRRNHTTVATAFKLVKTSPMHGKVRRFEKLYLY